MKEILINTSKKEEIIDITNHIESSLNKNDGYVYVMTPHTTAALTINENTDNDVKQDIIKGLSIFDREDYLHNEGNSQAHIKSSLIGTHLTLRFKNGKLILGTWQGIMFCEFDGPRKRKILIDII